VKNWTFSKKLGPKNALFDLFYATTVKGVRQSPVGGADLTLT